MEGQARRRRASAAARQALQASYARAAVIALLGLLLLFGGYVALRVWSAIHAISPNAGVGDVLSMVGGSDPVGSVAYKIKHGERVNLLLLGYGGPGHDGPYLTDSIMLLSIQPASHQAVMVSLPRDLWVRISTANGSVVGKLNSAYADGVSQSSATGGGEVASTTVARITGLSIDGWVGVDFKAFRDVVNALGGIRIDVPKTLDDPYYPRGETNGMIHVHFNPGWQTMNGEQALEYARSRETTSDFDRSRRQQLILLAVRQRVFSLNAIPKMFSLLTALSDNVRTNLRPQDMQQLVALAGQIKDANIHRVSIDTSNFLRSGYSSDGQYILQPLDPTYGTLQHYLASVLPDSALLSTGATFKVDDGSQNYWVPYGDGSPARISTSLFQAIGLHATAGPASSRAVRQTEILDGSGGKNAQLVAWLQSYFGAVVNPVAAPATGPAVTVVLGANFTAKAFPYP